MRIIKLVKRRRSTAGDSSSGVQAYELLDTRGSSPMEREVGCRPANKSQRTTRANSSKGLSDHDLAQVDSQGALLSEMGNPPDVDLTPLSLRKKEFQRLLNSGIRLLAMREHSIKEIQDKLNKKTESMDLISAVVEELLENGYLSNERFTDSYVRTRANKGFGPIKIKSELKTKGISDTLVNEYLEVGSPIWIDRAVVQYQKKYGDSGVSDYNAWAKRARFMQSRGFTMEHIQVALPEIEFD